MEYTLTNAAKLTRLNKSTLFRAIKAGRLSARRDEDGAYKVDASELARVYDLQHVARNDVDAMQSAATGEEAPATAATVGAPALELVLQRARMLEDQLAREREDRERERLVRDQEREEHGETVRDLRRRLDRAEERVLALTSQPAPHPPPEPAQAPPAVVEELRRRLEESEALVRTLAVMAPQAPQAAQGGPEEARTPLDPAKAVKGFIGRFLGR